MKNNNPKGENKMITAKVARQQYDGGYRSEMEEIERKIESSFKHRTSVEHNLYFKSDKMKVKILGKLRRLGFKVKKKSKSSIYKIDWSNDDISK